MYFVVPKTVVISNGKLSSCWIILVVIFIIFNIWRFSVTRGFTVDNNVETVLSMEIVEADSGAAMIAYDMFDSQPICRKCRQGIYGEDCDPISERKSVYDDLTIADLEPFCLEVCKWNQIPEAATGNYRCITTFDAFRSRGSRNALLLTSIQELKIAYNGSERHAKLHHSIIPSVKYGVINFKYRFYTTKVAPGFFGLNPSALPSGDGFNAITIIMKHSLYRRGNILQEELLQADGTAIRTDQQIWRVLPANESHYFEIVLADFISAQDGTPYNFDEKAELTEDVLLHGREFSVKADCYNDVHDLGAVIDMVAYTDMGAPSELSHETPACVVRFDLIGHKYTVQEGSFSISGAGDITNGVNTWIAGVHFVALPGGGVFRFLDLNKSIASLVTFIVMLCTPTLIVIVFMKYCLGHLSNVYRQATEEHFDLVGCAANWAVRLMRNSVPFVQLADVLDEDGQTLRISKHRFKERLRVALSQYNQSEKGSELDSKEIANVVKFSYDEVMREPEISWMAKRWGDSLQKFSAACLKRPSKKHARKGSITRTNTPAPNHLSSAASLGTSTATSASVAGLSSSVAISNASMSTASASTTATRHKRKEKGMDITDFSRACSGEQLSFDTIVTLLDRDRKPTWLENLFMPKHIRKKINVVWQGSGDDEDPKKMVSKPLSLEKQKLEYHKKVQELWDKHENGHRISDEGEYDIVQDQERRLEELDSRVKGLADKCAMWANRAITASESVNLNSESLALPPMSPRNEEREKAVVPATTAIVPPGLDQRLRVIEDEMLNYRVSMEVLMEELRKEKEKSKMLEEQCEALAEARLAQERKAEADR